MTVPQLSPAPDLTEAEKATVERFEAAEEPEEVVVIRAMLDLADELEDEAQEALEKYPSNGFDVPIVRDIRASANSASFIADRIRTALTALRGDRAPLAGQHTTDEEADRG